MPIEDYFTEGDAVRAVRMHGIVSRGEFRTYRLHLLADQRDTHRITFVDMSEMEDFEFGFDDAVQHADLVSDAAEKRQREFAEIVLAPTDFTYGIARMYETVVNNRYQICVFREEERARKELTLQLAGNNPTEA